MTLLHDDRLTGFLQPVGGERFVVVIVKFSRRVVGDVQQRDSRSSGARR